ncbi:MBL fold metallo-hydrolase [Variovorax sp. YR752]|uniref:MBL fold metallo-hydrolase n=1 Tax=Variovorax sp. YR752 TaxID=1884383 RepID=UPI003138455F
MLASRHLTSRTCGTIAVAGDDDRWLLVNASPDIADDARIDVAAAAGRVAGLVLLDAQLEHAGTLARLARGRTLDLYATPGVFEELTGRLPMLGLHDGGGSLRWHLVPVAGDVRSAEFRVEGLESLRFVAVDDGGCAAPGSQRHPEALVGDSIALLIEDRRAGQRLVYSPGASSGALPWMEGADCLLVNGSGCPMSVPQPSPDARFAATGARRTVFLHFGDDVEGLELAFAGMEIDL